MNKLYLLLFALAVAFTACQDNSDGRQVLAQVGESRLYLDDVLAQMQNESLHTDSAAFVKRSVDEWIDEELVYQQGTRSLSNYGQLMQQVEEYRRLLVSQSFEQELLRQHEQDLTDDECQAFYEKYGKQLLLSEPVVKGFFVKLPIDGKTKHKHLKEWLRQLQKGDTDHMEELEQYLQLHAVDYDGFLEQWMPLSFVSDRLPEQIVDAASFLKLDLIELADDEFSYFVLLTDYRLDKEESPYEYVLPQIRELLLNQRSREFLKQSHKEMRKRAIENGNLKLYISE